MPRNDFQRRAEGLFFLTLFMACIPAANWLIGNMGTVCPPDSPCLIPVLPNVMAPSGVLTIGLALVLRDLVQRRLGPWWAVAAIFAGAGLSARFASPSLILASTVAFLLSELADLAVYTPLQRKRLMLAVFASSVVGLVIDSLLFLYIAFGNIDFLLGQVIGKLWMVILAMPLVILLRQRDRRIGLEAV